MNNVPKHWEHARVGDLFKIVGGGTPSTEKVSFWEGKIPWISSADISAEGAIRPRRTVSADAIAESATNLIPTNSVVVVTRVGLGKVALTRYPLCCSQDCHALTFGPNVISPEFVAFQMQWRVSEFKSISRGTTISGVTKKQLEHTPFVIPPLREQRRIAAEIEKQFTRLDASEAILRRAERRAHVLERELTRPCKLDPYVSGSLPQLPREWSWTSAQHVCEFITKGTTPAKQHLLRQGDIPYIKVNNLSFTGELNFETSSTFIPREIHERELARSEVLPGDVLMNIVGPPLGKVSSVPATYPRWNINQAIARFRPKQSICPEFLALVLRSSFTLRWLLSMTKATVGQVNLTLETCRDIPVPVPPMDEQVRIAQTIAALASELQVNRKALTKAQLLTLRLRQAVLVKAFSGQLVPQDPNDEPASVLLDRIRTERTGTASQRPERSARTKAAVKSE